MAGRPKTEVAYESLLNELCSGRYTEGDALLPLRELGRQLALTPFALRKALAELEEKGFIERRHGSGNYVKDLRPATSIGQSIALCMDLRGHIFDELSRKLIFRLQASRLPVLPVDVSLSSCDGMLLSTIRAKPKLIVLQGNVSLPPDVINQTPAEVAVVVLFNQITRLTRKIDWRVEIDHTRGGQIAAEALWREGHRNVIVVDSFKAVVIKPGQADWRPAAWPGPAFMEHWQNLGGRVDRLSCDWNAKRRGHLAIDIDAFKRTLKTGKKPATAVFASRDVDLFDLQSLLADNDSALLNELAWFGYGDTPWRLISPAHIGSINWRLDAIADCVCRLTSMPRRELDGGVDKVVPMLAQRPEDSLFSAESDWMADASTPAVEGGF